MLAAEIFTSFDKVELPIVDKLVSHKVLSAVWITVCKDLIQNILVNVDFNNLRGIERKMDYFQIVVLVFRQHVICVSYQIFKLDHFELGHRVLTLIQIRV